MFGSGYALSTSPVLLVGNGSGAVHVVSGMAAQVCAVSRELGAFLFYMLMARVVANAR